MLPQFKEITFSFLFEITCALWKSFCAGILYSKFSHNWGALLLCLRIILPFLIIRLISPWFLLFLSLSCRILLAYRSLNVRPGDTNTSFHAEMCINLAALYTIHFLTSSSQNVIKIKHVWSWARFPAGILDGGLVITVLAIQVFKNHSCIIIQMCSVIVELLLSYNPNSCT